MRRTAACLLLCLLAPALSAQTPDGKALEQVFLDPVLKTGDLDTYAVSLAALIEKANLPALRRWDEIEGDVSNPRAVFKALSVLAKDDFKACGSNADEFVDAYVHLSRRMSSDLAWQNLAVKWRGVTETAYVGPFAEGVASAHDDAFSPEVMLDFAATYDGIYGPVAWAHSKYTKPLKAELDLYAQQRWAGYCYYVATALVSDEDRAAVIKLKFSGPGKIWLNGEYLLDADARGQELPDELELSVNFKRGRNVLMVKLSSISMLRIRVRDTAGQPFTNVLAVVPAAGDKPVPMKTGQPTMLRPPGPKALQGLSEKAAMADDRLAALWLLAQADEAKARGLEDDFAWCTAQAAKLLPADPLVQLAFVRSMDRSRLYSGGERRRVTRDLTTQLLAADPALIPGVFAQAELLASDERFREAVKLLQGSLEHTPAKWRVHLQLAEVFRDAGWVTEQQSAINAAMKDAPDSLPVLSAASDFYASVGALARETELDKQRLAILPGEPDAHMSLANTLSRTGDLDGSIKHWRILVAGDPGNDFMLGRMAEVLAGNGKLSEALEVYEKLAAAAARPEEALYEAARVCLQLGREDQGMQYLDRVVAVDPGHHLARRQLQRMRGESEDFWSAHATAWEEIMQHDITREQFPRAASAMLLDELIQYVYADGSSATFVHQVRKILTQEGVDARGKERITGELIVARTIQPDGTIIEPITQPGGLVEFPGVKVGALLDVAYVLRADGGPHQTLDGDAFFFVDQTLNEPFAISRWVVLAPSAMRLNPIYHNLTSENEGVTIKQEKAGAQTVWTWDVRNPRMPEYEQFMPAAPEFVPWVELVNPRDWRVRARKLADEGLRKVMDTPLIRERAKQLCGELTSDEARARAIYAWVNATFTTAGDSWNAHQALKSGAGDREDLFISLCVAAGIEVGFAYVDPPATYKRPPEESLPRPHWAYPNKDDFDSMAVVVRREAGGYAWLDMTDRLRPFGEIPSRLANAPAILWFDGEYELAFLPGTEREKDRFENRVHIKLKSDGSATLEGSITILGETRPAMNCAAILRATSPSSTRVLRWKSARFRSSLKSASRWCRSIAAAFGRLPTRQPTDFH